MTTIVNYKMGNIRSIQNALEYLGFFAQVSSDPNVIADSEKLILPGVGSFRTAMENLRNMKIVDALNEAVLMKKRPVLGICLGMQLLSEVGTEDGITKGLGWIPGNVVRFNFQDPLYRVPHVGFNSVQYVPGNSQLFQDMGERADFYFVHSYHFACADLEDVSGWTDYHDRFVASVERGHIFGTQFHPEKSQSNGLHVLKNFMTI
jgi:imidazole glycerol-phosphate synthase subunit HisH